MGPQNMTPALAARPANAQTQNSSPLKSQFLGYPLSVGQVHLKKKQSQDFKSAYTRLATDLIKKALVD
jgi:hypothetical protein